MSHKSACAIVFALSALFYANAAVNITGIVKDQASGTGIRGAVVSLATTGLTCITDSLGRYSFNDGTTRAFSPAQAPQVINGRLLFSVANETAPVRITLHTLSGRLAAAVCDQKLVKGEYRIGLFSGQPSTQMYVLRVQQGGNAAVMKLPFINGSSRNTGILVRTDNLLPQRPVAKTAASLDSIFGWAVGYNTGKLGIDNLVGVYNLTLSRTVPAGQVQVIQTTQAGDRLAAQASMTFAVDDGSSLPTLTVTPATTYQTIYGFGASFTETAVYNLCKVTAARKSEVLNLFFNPYTGAGFSLIRTTINSCDFSLGLYDYDGTANDYDLVNFDMSHDMRWMVPTIRQALRVPGSNFKLFASPWAPPAWMKTSNNRIGADGGGGGSLRTQCYQSWANYFVKYIRTMKANGITMWGVTIQNEPAYDAYWEACVYSADQERDFLKNNLGPTFADSGIDTKIMIWDHNKDIIVSRVTPILSDPVAKNYAWGIAYHRYAGDQFPNMVATHDAFPTYPMIATECSVRETWAEAERMAHEIIGDINNWSGGYLTWNLVTDYAGGPFHNRPAPGSCVGPIVLDSVTNGMQIFPNYYYMAHFSKYVQPGAVRVLSALSGSTLQITTCKNTNGCIVVEVLNTSAGAVAFKIKQGTQIIKPTIPAHSLMSFIYF
jgi:glucosylceramidase